MTTSRQWQTMLENYWSCHICKLEQNFHISGCHVDTCIHLYVRLRYLELFILWNITHMNWNVSLDIMCMIHAHDTHAHDTHAHDTHAHDTLAH